MPFIFLRLVTLLCCLCMSTSLLARTPEGAVKNKDTNGDGKVDLSEWDKSKKIFKKIDRNGDGYITANEFAAHWTIMDIPFDEGGQQAAEDSKSPDSSGNKKQTVRYAEQGACYPAPRDAAKLIEIKPGFHKVDGDLAIFDPCHSSVNFSLPGLFSTKLAEKPPLMIIAHGGGGVGLSETEMANRMNARGVATLLFDAYELNGFNYKGTNLFVSGVSNESRQRMIYKAAFTAYQWAIQQGDKVDTSRIFINGLSNGGSVAVNLAGMVDPAHVRTVFAEGASPSGLGFPDKLTVPLWLIYGSLDNYGGKTKDDFMVTRTELCKINFDYHEIEPSLAPAGFAKRCSRFQNPDEMVMTPKAWYEKLKAQGEPVELHEYANAAHGILLGPITRKHVVYGKGPTARDRFAWTGSGSDTSDRYIADLIGVIKATY